MVPANYDDVLDQLRQAGLLVDSLQTGRLVRCRVDGDRERRGWYMLHELATDAGDVLLVGSFGVWHGNDNGAQKVELRRHKISDEQRDALKRRLVEDRRRADEVRRAQAERAAARARAAWARLDPVGESDYLTAKAVQAFGLRFTPNGSAVVPMFDASGQIHGLQFLRTHSAAEKAKRPTKEYWPSGLAKKGRFYQIGMVSDIVLVCEGYATGASLFMATQLPVAIAFDANNIEPVAAELRARHKRARILICYDDDAFAKCPSCQTRFVLAEHAVKCPTCDAEHRRSNAGAVAASTAALAIGASASTIRPQFEHESERRQRFLDRGLKLTDFNDLHVTDGLNAVRMQVETQLLVMGYKPRQSRGGTTDDAGAGAKALRPIETVEHLIDRYVLIYGYGGAVFDRQEHEIVSLSDMRDLCLRRELHRAWSESPSRRVVRSREVGFDPGGTDPEVTCNLFGGWPTKPRRGDCSKLVDLLRHMCGREKARAQELFEWVLRWCAYPIQHPGAKMKTTIVVHGPQGTGKNMFFEALMRIYGPYGRVIDQSAIEDKFNDWASRKLFLVADEVVARSEVYHVKNKLKAFITGDWIRINPKNLAARDERNHVNMVFLSNEAQPVVLEEDDRRHAVIWTPEKLDARFYTELQSQIHSGGVEAFHDYLLSVPLGDFSEATLPPDTEARRELIELSIDSTSQFFHALMRDDIPNVRPMPALTTDVYEVYRAWCQSTGVRAGPLKRLVNQLTRKHGVAVQRKRYIDSSGITGPHSVVMFEGEPKPEHVSETGWLGDCIKAFRNAGQDSREGLHRG